MHCINCFLCIMAVKSKSVRHIVYQYSQDEHSVNTGRSKETLGIDINLLTLFQVQSWGN